MFGRKAAQIRQLQESLAQADDNYTHQSKRVRELEASELKLMGQIREMDQLIFQMAQKTSWDQQRPIFNQLQAQTERRMRLESDRIKQVLIPEMQKAYR